MAKPSFNHRLGEDDALAATVLWLLPLTLLGWICITCAYILENPQTGWKAGALMAALLGAPTGLYVSIRTRRKIVIVPTVLLVALLILMIFELLKQF